MLHFKQKNATCFCHDDKRDEFDRKILRPAEHSNEWTRLKKLRISDMAINWMVEIHLFVLVRISKIDFA